MVRNIISKGKRVLVSTQSSVLSAATIIMFMIIVSRLLGLVRQRVLAHFFAPDELSLFFAAFRLPDLVFEVLVFGTFSSAFIPVFTRLLKKGNHSAWRVASVVVNFGLIFFIFFAIVFGIQADKIYALFAPGYGEVERKIIVSLARVLFAAQGFFVISYVLTGVLESLRRFLVPALAPLFYNLGIILGTLVFSEKLGILAPAIGVVIGAFSHFLIQLPLAVKFGFRFRFDFKITPDVKKIAKLALPRVIEVSFLQVLKVAELFFASLVSTAAYTYYTFGNSLQLLPVGIFGISIAKAALPTLSRQVNELSKFQKTLFSALYDMAFLIAPVTSIFIVLRIPIVRLAYGTDIFSWEATVQTGYVLSAFSFGIFFQAANALLARGFYALHDTKTPVVVSISAILQMIILNYLFTNIFHFDVWGLALAFSLGSLFQAVILFYLINKKVSLDSFAQSCLPIAKSAFSAFASGIFMFLVLKVFDRSVWVKRLSFLGKIEATRQVAFESFVFDTRYTVNLLILTVLVTLVGVVVYMGFSLFLNPNQLWTFFNLLRRIFIKRKITPIPAKEQEPVAPTPSDTIS